MKRWSVLLLLVVLFTATAAGAQPQIPPKPTGSIYAQDQAGVLAEDTKQKINSVGEQLAALSKAQVVVLTVKTLGEAPLEEYSLEVLRQWGIGDRTLNNGVLMLVAVDDRQSRIEVGYGLEGALPDARTGRIQDEYMIPFFKEGDYNSGILNGYLALVRDVAAEYNLQVDGEPSPAHTGSGSGDEALSWWGDLPGWAKLLIIGFIFLLFIIDWVVFGGTFTMILFSLLRRGGGGGFGGGGGGGFGGGSGGGGGSSRRW